jgi:hypothetical protein
MSRGPEDVTCTSFTRQVLGWRGEVREEGSVWVVVL